MAADRLGGRSLGACRSSLQHKPTFDFVCVVFRSLNTVSAGSERKQSFFRINKLLVTWLCADLAHLIAFLLETSSGARDLVWCRSLGANVGDVA